ncbi:Dbl homology domain-containing protein [Lichtheimia hyalospora FSU 10163]|nr:Dbl homology domain-containing protein [Lichtheimia hyalospora FSU 10163]
MGVDYTPPLSFEQDFAGPPTAQQADSDSNGTIAPSQCSPLPPTAVSYVESLSSSSSQPTLTASSSLSCPMVNNNDHRHSDGSDSHYPILKHHLTGSSRAIQHNPAIMSCIAQDFVDCIKQLNMKRELNCTDQFPLSFTGEEAVIVMQQVLPCNLQPILYHKVARALLHISPPLICPVSSDKPLQNIALYDSPFAVYTIVGETMDGGYAQGVYTEIVPCYTYGCNQGTRGCYAPTCPNRPSPNSTSLSDEYDFQQRASANSWSVSIPRYILEHTPKKEISRQEAIHEIIFSEERYVQELEILDQAFAKPLGSAQCIDIKRRSQFCNDVFSNYMDILNIHKALVRDLRDCQWEARYKGGFVDKIGHVYLQHIPHFLDIYTQYCSNALFAKHTVEREESSNTCFRDFLLDNERKCQSHNFSISHYIILPIVRLQLSITLTNAILEYTSIDHPDNDDLAHCVETFREMNRFADAVFPAHATLIYEVNDNLTFKPDEPAYRKQRIRDQRLFTKFAQRRMNSMTSGSTDIAQELCKKVTFLYQMITGRLYPCGDIAECPVLKCCLFL